MSGRISIEKIGIKTLQYYHHATINNFGEQETIIEAISNRPGILGHNPIAYLSLLVRKPNFHVADLEDALLNDKTLIRAPAFRGSLFLLNSTDYPLYYRSFGQFLQQRGLNTLLKYEIDKNHLANFSKKLSLALSDVPVTVNQIADIIFEDFPQEPNKNALNLIIQKLCDIGVLIKAGTKGWKANDFTYALLEKWIPEISLKPDNPEIARTETVKRYLKTYGPATIDDISWWTGLNLQYCQRSISYLRKETIRYKIEGLKDDLIGLRECVETVRRKLPIEEPVGLLPPWDCYTMGWQCRKRMYDKGYAPYIFDKNSNPTSVIVHLGKIVGVWQFRDHEISVFEFHLFEKYRELKKYILPKIEEYCQMLKKTCHNHVVNIIERTLPEPLDKTEEYNVLWPLGKNSHNPYKVIPDEAVLEKRTANTFRKRYLDNEYLVKPNSMNTNYSQGI